MTDERQQGLGRLLERLAEQQAAGEMLGGWKVGLTSGAARDVMGPGFRPFGYLLRSRIFESGADLPLAEVPGISVENELCFIVGQALRGNPDRATVIRALESAVPAFEVVQYRFSSQPTPAEVLADNLSQWGIVTGQPADIRLDTFDFASLRVVLSRNGSVVEEVPAEGHIDDHFDSIGALVRQLDGYGLGLEPGQRVITGAFTRQPAAGAAGWRGDFGPDIGGVELSLS